MVMAKKIKVIRKRIKVVKNSSGKKIVLNEKDKAAIREMVLNENTTRASLLNRMIDPRRDINKECGYPDPISTNDYRIMYDREGVATRVVALFPEESWSEDPTIEENDDPKSTDFEEAWQELDRELNIFSYMYRADELSGIGRFGILLLGLSDGEDMSKMAKGINEEGEPTGETESQLLFLRAFDESVITIKDTESNTANPRYGKPTMYTIKFEDTKGISTTKTPTQKEQDVHWSRVIHIADNRKNSEVYGVPRMQTLFNRLYDLRKITGGSGEMFWKGGFPGLSFEMDPNAEPLTTAQQDDFRQQTADYANGLQRFLRLQGIVVNSLDPQVADPKAHVEVQLEMIAVAIGVPKRIFMGAEQAKLASAKDTENWNKRIKRRQNKYLTPYVIRPFIDRLIVLGVLPEPEEYNVNWKDLDAPSEKDKAEVLKVIAEGLAKYVGGNVAELIPEEIFFKMFMGMDADEIKEITKAALKRQGEMEEDEDDDLIDELNQDDDEGEE